MERKYEFTEEQRVVGSIVLHRIRALRSFGFVMKGELGGWIEKEENLSHERNCWVEDNAKVFGNAKVLGNARVFGDARVFGKAEIYGNARVHENARVYGNTRVFGDARVCGNAEVFGNARVFGVVRVCGNAEVYGTAKVYGTAQIKSVAKISSNSTIESANDFIVIGPIGSRKDYTTFSKSENGINVDCGCFSGTIEEFEERVKETHKGNKHELDYLNAIIFVKNKLGLNKEEK